MSSFVAHIGSEEQTVREHCLKTALLSSKYAATILCSATQPALEQIEYPILLDEVDSMTGDVKEDFEVSRRTKIIPEVTPYGYSYEEATEFCKQKFNENGNLLLIVNTKSAARIMFEKLKDIYPNINVFHLSTNLCSAHRHERIEYIKYCLSENRPVICVTTQLIEAGVDISFRCVVRSLAGLDNIAQAAGRCNRNGEYDTKCPVYVIKLKEEAIDSLEGIKLAQQITQGIFSSTGEYFSNEVQNNYFRTLYQRVKTGKSDDQFSYPVKEKGIRTSIFDLLSTNDNHFKISGLPESNFFRYQAFKTAGSLFHVIDNNTQDVIVPYNEEARELIEELDSDITPIRCQEVLRKAQKFSVGVYEGQSRKLWENNGLRKLKAGAFALEEQFYDAALGVVFEGAEHEFLLY